MEMHSRKGTLADIERLVEIEESAVSGGYYLYDNRHFYFDGILNKGEMVVALNEEEHPVGIGQYSILPDGSGWLECLRVEKQWQSQGAGKAIYRRYMALAEETNAPSVAMFTGRKNLASKGLAEKHGFHLAAAYMGYDLALPGAVKEIVTGFHLVVDEEEAVKLLTQAAPSDQVVKLKALEAFQKAADGKATKLIIPSEIQGLAGLAASAKEIFTDQTKDEKR